eukprot:768787-Hanusia_phi.AAC.11
MKLPSSRTSTPDTAWKRAAPPKPSSVPAVAEPATVSLTPVASHRVEGEGQVGAREPGRDVDDGQPRRGRLVQGVQGGGIAGQGHPGRVSRAEPARVHEAVAAEVPGAIVGDGAVGGQLHVHQHGLDQGDALGLAGPRRGVPERALLAGGRGGRPLVHAQGTARAERLPGEGLLLPSTAVHAHAAHLHLVGRTGDAVNPEVDGARDAGAGVGVDGRHGARLASGAHAARPDAHGHLERAGLARRAGNAVGGDGEIVQAPPQAVRPPRRTLRVDQDRELHHRGDVLQRDGERDDALADAAAAAQVDVAGRGVPAVARPQGTVDQHLDGLPGPEVDQHQLEADHDAVVDGHAEGVREDVEVPEPLVAAY